jgi:hypothetical protein
MRALPKPLLIASALVGLTAAIGRADISPYSQDFEALDQTDPTALTVDGWLAFANVFDAGGGFLYNYGPFPAPNGGPAFSAITNGQGGPSQGNQQLVTYSDYNNGDHGNGFLIETNVFQEQIVGAADVGQTWTFTFDAKLGDLVPNSTALAFIKLIDNTNFTQSGFVSVDMTSTPTTWSTYTLSFTPAAGQVGHFFQIGFLTNATNYTPSGIVYDNVVLSADLEPGTAYCLGDGSGTPCPCMNDNDGSNGPAGCAYTGTPGGAALTATGPGSATDTGGETVLHVTGLQAGQPGLFFQGTMQINGGDGVVLNDGLRCCGGTVRRLYQFTADASGSASTDGSAGTCDMGPATTGPNCGMSLSAVGGVSVGSTFCYQYWFRTPGNSPCGTNANLSNGYEITWAP